MNFIDFFVAGDILKIHNSAPAGPRCIFYDMRLYTAVYLIYCLMKGRGHVTCECVCAF